MPGLDSPRTGLVPERGLVPGDSTAAGGAAGAAQLLSPRGLSNMAAVVGFFQGWRPRTPKQVERDRKKELGREGGWEVHEPVHRLLH